MKAPHLLLLEVADGLNWQFAFDWRGGVAWFQLDDGLGSLVQTRRHRLEFIQLLSLLLSSIERWSSLSSSWLGVSVRPSTVTVTHHGVLQQVL